MQFPAAKLAYIGSWCTILDGRMLAFVCAGGFKVDDPSSAVCWVYPDVTLMEITMLDSVVVQS
jgi:hypothetical protein